MQFVLQGTSCDLSDIKLMNDVRFFLAHEAVDLAMSVGYNGLHSDVLTFQENDAPLKTVQFHFAASIYLIRLKIVALKCVVLLCITKQTYKPAQA